MPTNLIYDEATGKYYDDAGNEVTITDGAPVVQGLAQPDQPDAPAPEAETPTTVIPAEDAPAEDTPTSESSSSDGELLDVDGAPQLARVRFTEREATDTEPAEYREEAGNVVVGDGGALRFQKFETQEGGQV